MTDQGWTDVAKVAIGGGLTGLVTLVGRVAHRHYRSAETAIEESVARGALRGEIEALDGAVTKLRHRLDREIESRLHLESALSNAQIELVDVQRRLDECERHRRRYPDVSI